MVVKRISYFTFLIAITTMATAGSCAAASADKDEWNHADEITTPIPVPPDCDPQVISEMLETMLLSHRQFRLRAIPNAADETVGIWITFLKGFGEIANNLTNSDFPDPFRRQLEAAACVNADTSVAHMPGFLHGCDKRRLIAARNPVLLE